MGADFSVLIFSQEYIDVQSAIRSAKEPLLLVDCVLVLNLGAELHDAVVILVCGRRHGHHREVGVDDGPRARRVVALCHTLQPKQREACVNIFKILRSCVCERIRARELRKVLISSG